MFENTRKFNVSFLGYKNLTCDLRKMLLSQLGCHLMSEEIKGDILSETLRTLLIHHLPYKLTLFPSNSPFIVTICHLYCRQFTIHLPYQFTPTQPIPQLLYQFTPYSATSPSTLPIKHLHCQFTAYTINSPSTLPVNHLRATLTVHYLFR